ncbi:hypothetical protein [Rubripirellula reticaptiva]|uniref:APCDD1 domain-containing protein n=1 Tax=Rubripirellula reticaptiva TaxID=2528013 RepID=A0A5C6F5H3_9BACT|nr:hypothetical protein [Rubripirellula reticaptiva]TWU55774.1 hypothetical protein Poly59_20750 [Rubripirellula reticaptiva]
MLRSVFIGGMFAAFAAWTSSACTADESVIYKIEEDWEMVINEPDPANCSPQVTFFTSPSADAEDIYFQLQMNYSADAQFSSGGFHVAAFQGGHMHDEARSGTEKVLASSGDIIRWTSVMAVVDEKLLFAVKDGYSDEWGAFGGPDYLVRIPTSSIQNLATYHPRKSLETVDVGFGANRIDSLTLRRVRVFYVDGRTVNVSIDSQP